MRLVGRTVKHNTFGNGIVTDFSGNIVTIGFSQGDKKFIYPDAFSHFLTLKDQSVQSEIDAILNKQLQEEKAKKQSIQEEQDRRQRIRNLKITQNSQAAFNLDPKDIDEVFLSGTVSTGCYLSGYSKGEPRIPSRMKPNSACLLTTCPENASEKDRQIIGVFMARDDFLGDLCKNGIVESHDEYKIRLSTKNTLSFWDYFNHTDPIPNWGNTAFKYFSNNTMQKILLDIENILDGTEQESMVHEFYQYFCEINHLPEIKK